jgi:Bacterial extracellular solute-binding protein
MSFARYRGENTTENEPFFAIVPPPIMLMIIIRKQKVSPCVLASRPQSSPYALCSGLQPSPRPQSRPMRSISISARQDDSDALLYDGVPVNVIEGDGPELLARMKAQGKNSPADVFLTVNAGNLWLADKENLFQPVQSKTLDARIPASLRSPKYLWFGFSTRAHLIFVNAKRGDPKLVQSYEALADPKLKGKICMRSSSAVCNLSLLGALIAHWGKPNNGLRA